MKIISTFVTGPNATSIRFLVAGGAATAAHLSAMGLLVALGVDAVIATGTGAALGAAVNYCLQYHWTFLSRRAHREAINAFLLVAAANWLLNLALFAGLHRLAEVPALPAQVVTTALLTLTNYHLYRRVVFL